ncbi:hypothetical protein D6D22_10070 [Aureobasidium pullulans]|uniref:Uncharacterized protein n=1 Tax=Aureobasidium pullulans TaxID=5580 RepID=A0A4S8X3S5_AURPU|nr:hypothetical protein D6D22_10070 [Aureobasidium pullulans]
MPRRPPAEASGAAADPRRAVCLLEQPPRLQVRIFCMPNLTPASIPSKILDIWRKNYCYQGQQVVKDPSHYKDLQFTLLVQAQLTKQLPDIACGNCAAWTALAASMLHDVRVLCLFPAQWHVWRKCTLMLWPHTDPQEDSLQVSKSTQELCDGSDWQDRSKEHARAVAIKRGCGLSPVRSLALSLCAEVTSKEIAPVAGISIFKQPMIIRIVLWYFHLGWFLLALAAVKSIAGPSPRPLLLIYLGS